MVSVKKWQFFYLYFFRKYRPRKGDLRYSKTKKNAFLGYKNKKLESWKIKKLKKSNNRDFSIGVYPWFWSKSGHFLIFFLVNISQENIFHNIIERKNAFLGCKNKKLKRSKSWHFSKGVYPWFWSKNGHFSNFSF